MQQTETVVLTPGQVTVSEKFSFWVPERTYGKIELVGWAVDTAGNLS